MIDDRESELKNDQDRIDFILGADEIQQVIDNKATL